MRAKRVDENQSSLVAELRRTIPGISVHITSSLGQGFPDLVVGYRGLNYLFEVKDGNKPESARKLTPAEKKFKDTWKGSYYVVKNCEEILNIIDLSI